MVEGAAVVQWLVNACCLVPMATAAVAGDGAGDGVTVQLLNLPLNARLHGTQRLRGSFSAEE